MEDPFPGKHSSTASRGCRRSRRRMRTPPIRRKQKPEHGRFRDCRVPLFRESGSLRLSRRGAPLGHCRPSQASIRTPPSGRSKRAMRPGVDAWRSQSSRPVPAARRHKSASNRLPHRAETGHVAGDAQVAARAAERSSRRRSLSASRHATADVRVTVSGASEALPGRRLPLTWTERKRLACGCRPIGRPAGFRPGCRKSGSVRAV